MKVKIIEPGMIKTDFGGRSFDFVLDESMTEYLPTATGMQQVMAAYAANPSWYCGHFRHTRENSDQHESRCDEHQNSKKSGPSLCSCKNLDSRLGNLPLRSVSVSTCHI